MATLTGNSKANNLVGTNNADSINGLGGNDILNGYAGDDSIWGGTGADTITGGLGDDLLYGEAGNDLFLEFDGDGSDTIDGGSNTDTVNYDDNTLSAITLRVGTGTMGTAEVTRSGQTDTLQGIEIVVGSDSFGDTLDASSNTNIYGVIIKFDPTKANQTLGRADSKITQFRQFENFIGSAYNDTLNGNNSANFVFGGDGNDIIDGMGGSDTLNGGDGNDTILGSGGIDVLIGGQGNDSLAGGSGKDTYTGYDNVTLANNGNDIIQGVYVVGQEDTLDLSNFDLSSVLQWIPQDTGDADANFSNLMLNFGSGFTITLKDYFNNSTTSTASLVAGKGYIPTIQFTNGEIVDFNQVLSLLQTGGNQTIIGGGGDDSLFGDTGDDSVVGNAGNDTLDGNAGNDTLEGGSGNDSLNGGSGNDSLNGGSENDVYVFFNNWGTDTIVDSSGNDTVDFSNVTTRVTVNLNSGAGQEATDGTNTVNWDSSEIENVIGGTDNDYIYAHNVSKVLTGGAGSDTVDYSGVLAPMTLNSDGTLTNGVFNDTLNSIETVVGTSGVDLVDASGETGSVVINLASNTASGLGSGITGLYGFENISGGAMADTLTGNDANNVIKGGGGDDILNGGGGDDTFVQDSGFFTPGSDTIDGGSGTFDEVQYSSPLVLIVNTVTGTVQHDGLEVDQLLNIESLVSTVPSSGNRIDATGESAALSIDLSMGNVSGLTSGLINILGFAQVLSGSGDDTLSGDFQDNILHGGAGDDYLYGEDLLFGSMSNDTLNGGSGNDTLEGGDGDDVYVYSAGGFDNDIISDAGGLNDTIDLTSYATTDVLGWLAVDSNGDTFVDQLVLDLGALGSITIENYFDNTSTDDDLSGAGVGLMETIAFSDNPAVNFGTVSTTYIAG